jgi:holo-[acyl-carrier protein] synthase
MKGPATIGIGVDLVDVRAFSEQLADRASGFVDGTFTAGEQRAAKGDARRLAARFAAKEAFVKAWSGSRRGQPPALAALDLREIEVVDDGYGRPGLQLHGDVEAAVGAAHAQLSLSHDGPAAIAFVILERA